jgi:hypothetical protein
MKILRHRSIMHWRPPELNRTPSTDFSHCKLNQKGRAVTHTAVEKYPIEPACHHRLIYVPPGAQYLEKARSLPIDTLRSAAIVGQYQLLKDNRRGDIT